MAYRTPIEASEFTEQLQKLGNIQRLDDRLRGLSIALWIDAESFPLVDPDHRLRVATVLSYSDSEPDLTVYFEINDQDDQVVLRWIEPSP